MSGNERKYERIIKYLKGLLSNRERYDLEKEMMQDAFEEEAFEGLTRGSADELEADMELLGKRLKARIEPERKRSLGLFYRIAAGIILLAGISGILLLLFRTPSRSLITEKTGKVIQKSPPAVLPQALPDTLFAVQEESKDKHKPEPIPPVSTRKPVQKKMEAAGAPVSENLTEITTETKAVEAVSEERMAETEQVVETYHEPAVSRRKSEAAALAGMEKAKNTLSVAKVVDVEGNPLPGVTVLEKGSVRGTFTNIDGMFSLQEFDSGSVLSLSYIGYTPLEMNAKDLAGKEVPMTEDLMALEEVAVVGYGTQKKSDVTGAVAGISVEDISPSGNVESASFVNPAPPGGSAKAFKKWVFERLDASTVNAFPEKQKILVTVTVQTDGSVGDIRIRENVPEPLAEEFRRVITQSPRWIPARKDGIPVVAKVAIRFVIGEE